MRIFSESIITVASLAAIVRRCFRILAVVLLYNLNLISSIRFLEFQIRKILAF